ncbi:MAG: hypothetical protein J6C52_05925, partial [Clostridia bacterium]|nr:hypothetical protein [Clostridia bacterium]
MNETKRKPDKGMTWITLLKKKYIWIPLAAILLLAAMYAAAVYSPIPFIARWRAIWIETAMTTADHQWLATAFIPKSVIDDVMSKQTDTSDIVGGGLHLLETTTPPETTAVPEDTGIADETDAPEETTVPEETAPPEPVVTDILGQAELTVGGKDYAGYTVLTNDIEEGIVISEVTGTGYKGRVMLIDDPSRVYLGTTTMKNKEGLRIKSMLSHYDAIAGINASGFADPNDAGHGGDVIGLSYSDGEFWGSAVSYYGSVLMTSDDKLVVGNV